MVASALSARDFALLSAVGWEPLALAAEAAAVAELKSQEGDAALDSRGRVYQGPLSAHPRWRRDAGTGLNADGHSSASFANTSRRLQA